MANTANIFLVGASRGVGREIANYLTKQNLQVTALLRSEKSRAELEAVGVQVVLGDACDRTNNKILSAVDKNMLFTPRDFVEFSLD
ncbi:hypothetical protein NSMS1_26520 [Nostoc sp. MS1]|nr:hypothetical protein NSMS1_26520 [Nostoc sp. MS1]